jgi:hypothetical protein
MQLFPPSSQFEEEEIVIQNNMVTDFPTVFLIEREERKGKRGNDRGGREKRREMKEKRERKNRGEGRKEKEREQIGICALCTLLCR